MSKYYITNGDQYYSHSKATGPMLGVPVVDAQRFSRNSALSILAGLYNSMELPPGWCVQKYYSFRSGKNYVITNANKFIGLGNTIVSDPGKALSFSGPSCAASYIQANPGIIAQLGTPVIVNGNYETVDNTGLKVFDVEYQKKQDVVRKSEVLRGKRIHLTPSMRMAVYAKDKGTCQICGKPLSPDSFTIDHIVPLDRGGVNEISNFRCACSRCNKWKGNSLDDELVTMLKDVGSNYIYKNPYSDMPAQFIRAMVRGVIEKGRNKRILEGKKVI